jgi:hypothetical protein
MCPMGGVLAWVITTPAHNAPFVYSRPQPFLAISTRKRPEKNTYLLPWASNTAECRRLEEHGGARVRLFW